ncbi:MAG: NAD-dependent epimerase/dehydratase family protein [Candidatus Hodarchaeota archaeon]
MKSVKGYSVRILDNLDPQVHKNSPHFVRDLSSELELIVGDVRSADDMNRALQGVEVAFHLAAQTGVGQSMYEIGSYIDTNVKGTAILWETIIKKRLRLEKVILASSRPVYGEGAHTCQECGVVTPSPRSIEHLSKCDCEGRCPLCNRSTKAIPTPETHPLRPLSIYGLSKKMQEDICILEGTCHKIPIIILRYFNVYGNGQSLSNPYTGIASIFSSRLLSAKSIEIYEDGNMIRDFVNIEDVVRANLFALEKEGPQVLVTNVGSENPTTVLHLAEILQRKINPELNFIFSNRFRKGDIRACYADLTIANKELGSFSTIELKEWIDQLVRWAKIQKVTDRYDQSVAEMKMYGILEH